MSSREPRTHTTIRGHTGPEGGGLEARSEPGMRPDVGTPGQFEGPMDGQLPRYAEHAVGDPAVRRASGSRVSAHWQADGHDRRSMVELLRELSTESGDLVRQEVELAKAEMREKMDVFQRGMTSMAIGGGLLFAALLAALGAVSAGLTALFAQFMSMDIAVWLAPLIVMVVLAGIGWALIQGAKERMAHEGIVPRRTARSLDEDREWARSKVHEVKEEMTHGR